MRKSQASAKVSKLKAEKMQAKPRNDVVYLKTKSHKVTASKGSSVAQGPRVGGLQFPIGDKDYRIDRSFQEPYVFKVFYWAKRPDAIARMPDDLFHWHPDSEHPTLEAAQKRLEAVRGGAQKKSILIR